VKLLPLTVTAVPMGPLVGVNELIEGDCAVGVTVKSSTLVAVAPGLVTLIFPVVAPGGTVALICVSEIVVKAASVPLKRTLAVPVKFVPLTVTAVPTGPLVGVNEVIVGGRVTVKSPVLVAVPSGVVTLILPVVAPLGTVVLICAPETTVKVAAIPLN
jgi:hypothetical protein